MEIIRFILEIPFTRLLVIPRAKNIYQALVFHRSQSKSLLIMNCPDGIKIVSKEGSHFFSVLMTVLFTFPECPSTPKAPSSSFLA